MKNTARSHIFPRALLAACATAALAHAAFAGPTVAPYFETWAYGSGQNPNSLMAARNQGGVTAATLAFGIAGNGCSLGGGIEAVLSGSAKTDVANFRAAGGKVILSFGGASGTYLEAACSDDGMVNIIDNLLRSTGSRAIDFDVEGGQSGNAGLDGRRNRVIQRLQAAYPDLYVSFTLAATPGGLEDNGLRIVRNAKAAGVKVSIVNLMTMDYYDGNNSQSMGAKAIAAANSLFGQLKGIYPELSDAQIWAMQGNTPMIGVNDDQSEVFRQSDATQLATFAQQKGLGLLAYWAVQRDMPGGSDYNEFSLVNTKPYEFYQLLSKSSPPPSGIPDGTYVITSAYSGKCVDVAGASTANGAQVQQYQCNGTGAQRFALTNMGGGWYRLINPNSGKAIDIAAASTADGAKVQIYTDNGTNAQRFSFTQGNDPTTWVIRNQASSKCLDVADWSTNDAGKIQQWSCSGGQNQLWRVTKQN
jgi:hypothetical protein